MASAKPPWSECSFENPFRALYHIGNSATIPKIPSTLSEVARHFVLKCLTRDPDKRSSAVELLDHEWMRNLDTQQQNDFQPNEDSDEDSDSANSDNEIMPPPRSRAPTQISRPVNPTYNNRKSTDHSEDDDI